MRILFATYPWAFETPGGGEIQLLKYKQYLTAGGIDVVRHDPWGNGLGSADVVHFFSSMGGSVHFCAYVKQRGLPLVVSASLWLTEATRHLYPVGEIGAQLNLADAIVTNGEIESDQLASVLGLGRSRFTTVRNGCDPWFLEPVEPALFRARYGIEGDFVLNVGNIEPRKNQLNLIRAVRSAGLPLVILGRVRSHEYAAACWAEAGPETRHLGELEHEDPLLRSAYAACSAFCMPSRVETPGLAGLEAGAAGARLVITREGSGREYFGEEAIYVDPESVEDIAAGIAAALQTKPSESLRTRIADAFTWDKAIEPLHGLYQRLAGRA